ncbi:C1 family peptidase [Sphingopyxis sp.]|uniref:C1 family peptidase n=1 Tax=Sphingopyxis sp. TaxID=1908224 RepID=UPI003F6FADA4
MGAHLGDAADAEATTADRFAAFVDAPDANPAQYKYSRPFNHWSESSLVEQRFDWRTRGLAFVSRAQGAANVCTSYATAAMAEARWQLRRNENIRLAGAYVHCCLLGISEPLQGVNPETAARAATANGLAKSVTDGPPLSVQQCQILGQDRIGVSGFGWVAPGTPMLNSLVRHGPMVVEMNVPPDFPDIRRHDIYSAPVDPGTAKRHSMLLVGYDYPARTAVLLNSMGQGWGNDGFLRVRFGTGGVLDHFYAMQIGVAT